MLRTKTKSFDLEKETLIMGILNATPDSFSDGGTHNTIEKAVLHAKQMEADGAAIIDIGGESTRPDHDPVSVEEEIARVIPVIEAVKNEVSVPISVDTYKAETAEAAVKAGADIINDIWGAKWDREMGSVVAKTGVPIILMHNRNHTDYNSIMDDLIEELSESIAIVKQAGVDDSQIILDPGIGFGKTLKDNYTVLQQLEKIPQALPYPLLLGTSRKSFITEVLDIPAPERDNATGATTCIGIEKGARIIRVHDVKRHVELAKMTEAICKGAKGLG